MKTRDAVTRTIAIIGGGVSGTLTAYHLLRQNADARVVVIDPRSKLGLGLAYSTPSLRHLLNVPAGKISALPDEPDHFLNWLRVNHGAEAQPTTFAPRAVFGRYIHSLAEDIGLNQVLASVVDYRANKTGAILTLDTGRELRADFVVLATGNFDPAALPGISEEAIETGAYCHNAWAPETYGKLNPDAPVALIGTGLTGVDVVLRLRELCHRGIITAISRHGVFPNRHADYEPLDESAIPPATPATCVAYLHAIHTAIQNGADWRAVIDSLRATTNELWLALPLHEQKRFRRHLQRRWDVVRHRMAPPIADIIDAELKAGTLVIREGHLAAVDATDLGASVVIRTHAGTDRFTAARVINCTGPSMNYRRVGSALLDRLFEQGLISPGPLGAGFLCASTGAMIDARGDVSECMFNLGPGRLGTLLESIAVPEIRQQAVQLAELLSERVREANPLDGLATSDVIRRQVGSRMEAVLA
jgi:hydroxyacylglutathione hydrolase